MMLLERHGEIGSADAIAPQKAVCFCLMEVEDIKMENLKRWGRRLQGSSLFFPGTAFLFCAKMKIDNKHVSIPCMYHCFLNRQVLRFHSKSNAVSMDAEFNANVLTLNE